VSKYGILATTPVLKIMFLEVNLIYLAILDLKWPGFNSDAAFKALMMVLVVVAIGFIYILNKKRVSKIESAWRDIMRYAYSKRLNSGDVAILGNFFNNGGLNSIEKLTFLKDHKNFKSSLMDHFSKIHNGNEENLIQIVQKLFSEKEHGLEINDLEDIEIGEPCTVEFTQGIFLGTVVKKAHGELQLQFYQTHPVGKKDNAEIQCYFFRLGMGGFLLNGRARRMKGNGMAFGFDGGVEWKADLHLTAEMRRAMKITPHKDPKDKSESATEEESEALNEPSTILATTTKISDRAVLLMFTGGIISPLYLKKFDVWDAEIDLEAGRLLEVSGKIMLSSSEPGKYLMKFNRILPEQKKMLFGEIKKFSPTQEQLS